MLNYRTHAIVAGAVALWLSGAALAGTIASPVAVFPLHNATGETGLDWVAVGLQDSLTVDLWYISALHTKALPQFVEKIQNSCPDLALRCVTGQNLADWRRFAQARAYGGFLWGEYRREGAAWVLRLSWYDPGTEQPPTEQTVRRNSLPEVLAASSEALLALLASRDIAVSDAERDRVRAPKTPVLAAWEQNARGYWEQQRYGATDEAQRPTVRAAWERHLRAAVAADPAYAEAWNNLGWQRDTVESVADERVAHQCTPDAAPATPAPAVEPQTPSADGVFQRAVQYKPEYPVLMRSWRCRPQRQSIGDPESVRGWRCERKWRARHLCLQ